jgi:hypothetical protein
VIAVGTHRCEQQDLVEIVLDVPHMQNARLVVGKDTPHSYV